MHSALWRAKTRVLDMQDAGTQPLFSCSSSSRDDGLQIVFVLLG